MDFEDQLQALIDAFFTVLLDVLRDYFGEVFALFELIQQLTS